MTVLHYSVAQYPLISFWSSCQQKCYPSSDWNQPAVFTFVSKTDQRVTENQFLPVSHNKKSSVEKEPSPSLSFRVGLISGAFAGAIVDFVLFPLDTLKTRLQVRQGVAWSTLLFRGIYRGLGPAVAASAPAGAAFFGTYDFTKHITSQWLSEPYQVLGHMLSAIAGDVAGSTVRVPFEVVKQNLQAGIVGLYRGWLSLILREIPFDIIEFPLYEYLKKQWRRRRNGAALETWQSATCGSIAGAVAAAFTTPLDVAKTRLMLQNSPYRGIASTILRIAKEEGIPCLFSGIVPRVLWIGLGGAIFFGSFETCKQWLLISSNDVDIPSSLT
ncbi:Putative mitochondrial carrier protein PET8 [Galdieria sulphuraria]|nr:Putative mitochondrial carrier protein PET8 [Galdieria sulphuraria]